MIVFFVFYNHTYHGFKCLDQNPSNKRPMYVYVFALLTHNIIQSKSLTNLFHQPEIQHDHAMLYTCWYELAFSFVFLILIYYMCTLQSSRQDSAFFQICIDLCSSFCFKVDKLGNLKLLHENKKSLNKYMARLTTHLLLII